jgi:hypothetical protein
MKNPVAPVAFPDVRGGFSTLLGWAFRPRNFMKNLARLGGFPDMPSGFSTLSSLDTSLANN